VLVECLVLVAEENAFVLLDGVDAERREGFGSEDIDLEAGVFKALYVIPF
jgi:predicted glycosyltransferase involved in capsule biosynthesis